MSQTTTAPRRIDAATAALSASAFILAAMVLVQAARLAWPLGAEARADLVSRTGDTTTLTVNSGNDDLLVVLDGRGDQLYAYRLQAQTRLELLRSYDVKELFSTGRRLGAGRK